MACPGARDIHVVDGFQNPEEQQPNAHACGKQHGKPLDIGILGLGIRATQPNFRHRQENQGDAEYHEEIDNDHEEPVKPGGRKVAHSQKDGPGLIRKQKRYQNECNGKKPGDHEHRIMYVKSEWPQLAVDIVLPDLEVGLELVICRDRICHGSSCLWISPMPSHFRSISR